MRQNGPRPSRSAGNTLVAAVRLALAVAAGLPAALGATRAVVRTWGGPEIGADVLATDILQDPQGRIYVASHSLLEYDGVRWRSHPIPGAYSIRDIAFDPAGRIWAAALGDLGYFEPDTGGGRRFHSLRGHLPADLPVLEQVWRVFVAASYTDFVSQDRVLRWDGRGFTVFNFATTRRLGGFESRGRFFVDHESDGLVELTAAGPVVRIARPVLGERSVRWISLRDEHWLLGTSHGLFRFRDGTVTSTDPALEPLFRQQVMTRGTELGDGTLAFGTVQGGIVFVSPEGKLTDVLDESRGLASATVNLVAEARDGSLWAASTAHVSRIERPGSVRIFGPRDGIPGTSVTALARHRGKLHVGTGQGLIVESATPDRFESAGTALQSVHTLLRVGDDLAAGGYYLALRFSGDGAATLRSARKDVLALGHLHRSAPGTVLVGEENRVTRIDRDGRTAEILHSLPDQPRSMAEDDARRLWIATTARGVFVGDVDPAESRPARSPDAASGLPPLVGQSHVLAEPDGSLVVVAGNGGWRKAAGQARFAEIVGFPRRATISLARADATGALWVLHREEGSLGPCVARIEPDGAATRWAPHTVPALHTIGSVWRIFAERLDGEDLLWIGGTHGLLRHRVPGTLSAPRPAAPLVRTRIQYADFTGKLHDGAALPHDTRSIRLEFGAPEDAAVGPVRLESRIVGVDRDWIPAGRDGTRELTALRDGRYAVEVRAVAATGIAGESARVAFRVLPPWWRTGPAAAAGGVAALALAFGLFQLRLRALRRRNAVLEAKVRERTAELEAANAAKTEFVANMSHDIRNPLNGIVGLALALEDSRLDDRQREWAKTLRECGLYLSSLVDDVLDFAAIEAGRIELRPRDFCPGDLLRSVQTALGTEAAAVGAKLVIDDTPELGCRFETDTGRVQQILVNFVSNALKYAGGTVVLRCVTPAESPDELLFSVRDHGPGFDEADRARLFTKFTRLARATQARVPGTGLGLAACRLLADQLGGSVGVDSTPGQGARFFLRIPRQVGLASPPPPVTDLGSPRTTVLLVEDTDYNAWAAAAVLARLGLACDRAVSGADAISRFRAKRYNVVLLDRNLPDLDGTEVARRLREIEDGHPPALILAVTAYCTPADRALCLAAGMDAFVGKPLTPDKLRAVLAEAGGRPGASAPMALAPAAAATPDLALLAYLSDGSPDGLDRQIDRYLAEVTENENELAAAADRADLAHVARTAHQLKGKAQMTGAEPIAALAAEIETAAAAADLAAVGAHLRRLAVAIPPFKAAFSARRTPPPAAQSRVPAHSG